MSRLRQAAATAASCIARKPPMFARPSLDRKSTRLNSSHLVISYAVFCLKKKKKTHLLPLYVMDLLELLILVHLPRSDAETKVKNSVYQERAVENTRIDRFMDAGIDHRYV